MATVVRSDIYCCLRAQTIGKTKKIKETKDPSQNHSKTIENNKKNKKKKTKISARCEHHPSHLIPPGCILSRGLLIFVENVQYITKEQNFRDNGSKPCTSLLVAEIFVFFVFFVILDGYAMDLAGVFGFFDFIGFPYGLSFEAA